MKQETTQKPSAQLMTLAKQSYAVVQHVRDTRSIDANELARCNDILYGIEHLNPVSGEDYEFLMELANRPPKDKPIH